MSSETQNETASLTAVAGTAPAGRLRGLLILLLALSLSVMAAWVGWRLGRGSSGGAAADQPAILTEFRLPSLEGVELGPGDYAHKVLVVDFWATWCSPCHLQAAILEELWAEFQEREVQFLAVSIGEDTETVREFVETAPFPYPVLLDEEARFSTEASIYALPTLMVLDRQRSVAFLKPGVTGAAQLRQVLDQALASGSAAGG
jgi:peroxiredoxin